MGLPNSYPIDIVETDSFLEEADRLLTKEELSGLKTSLAREPEAGDMIPGMNGIRKKRWGQKSRKRGKQGGVRVIYYYRDLNLPLFLLAIYAKGERVDLTAKEKKALVALVDDMVASYNEEIHTTVLELVSFRG